METLMLVLLATVPATSVEYDRQVDFARYSTWNWGAVTRAGSPVADKPIREGIERVLAARGLSRVDTDSTLLVEYHGSKTVEIELTPIRNVAPTAVRYAEKGSLVVEMLDAASRKVIWRGQATGALHYGPSEIVAQVKAAVEKLLADFPPPARRPLP